MLHHHGEAVHPRHCTGLSQHPRHPVPHRERPEDTDQVRRRQQAAVRRRQGDRH